MDLWGGGDWIMGVTLSTPMGSELVVKMGGKAWWEEGAHWGGPDGEIHTYLSILPPP